MMDSNLKKMKNKKTQESWILNTILESKSKWNILISHHPWYNFDNDSSIETEDNDLKELYEKINNNKYQKFRNLFDEKDKKIYDSIMKECELILLNNR